MNGLVHSGGHLRTVYFMGLSFARTWLMEACGKAQQRVVIVSKDKDGNWRLSLVSTGLSAEIIAELLVEDDEVALDVSNMATVHDYPDELFDAVFTSLGKIPGRLATKERVSRFHTAILEASHAA